MSKPSKSPKPSSSSRAHKSSGPAKSEPTKLKFERAGEATSLNEFQYEDAWIARVVEALEVEWSLGEDVIAYLKKDGQRTPPPKPDLSTDRGKSAFMASIGGGHNILNECRPPGKVMLRSMDIKDGLIKAVSEKLGHLVKNAPDSLEAEEGQARLGSTDHPEELLTAPAV